MSIAIRKDFINELKGQCSLSVFLYKTHSLEKYIRVYQTIQSFLPSDDVKILKVLTPFTTDYKIASIGTERFSLRFLQTQTSKNEEKFSNELFLELLLQKVEDGNRAFIKETEKTFCPRSEFFHVKQINDPFVKALRLEEIERYLVERFFNQKDEFLHLIDDQTYSNFKTFAERFLNVLDIYKELLSIDTIPPLSKEYVKSRLVQKLLNHSHFKKAYEVVFTILFPECRKNTSKMFIEFLQKNDFLDKARFYLPEFKKLEF